MSKFPIPCRECGEPTRNTHCEECAKVQQRRRPRHRKHSPKPPAKDRGYGTKWRKLSELARRKQPFCSDCGATDDLQADHTPEAWERYEQGLPLRLKDIDVVCGPCNRKRGAARGATSRSKATTVQDDTGVPDNDTRPSQSHTDPLGGIPKRSPPRPCPSPNSGNVLIGGADGVDREDVRGADDEARS